MPSTKAIIRKSKINKKGECTVFIRYGHDQKSVDISTGVRVEPKSWNHTKQQINSVSGIRKTKVNEALIKERSKTDLYGNSIIAKVRSEIDGIARSLRIDDTEPEVHQVKERYLNKLSPKKLSNKNPYLYELFPDFVSASNLSNTTKRNYKTVLYHLSRYEEYHGVKLITKDVNIKFYDKFTNFLFNILEKPDGTVGLADNSVVSTIKNLKVFLTYLEKRGHSFKDIIPQLKASYQDTPIYYLTEDEIIHLYMHKFPEDIRLEKVRDVFVLNCYCGLRYSDLSRLNKHHIKDDTIQLTAFKNQKTVFIPLLPVAKEILEKYNYELPIISEQKFNDYIKEACREAGIADRVERIKRSSGNKIYKYIPKWEVITSHVAVKTYISLCCKKGISAKMVSQITGKTVKVINKHYLTFDKGTIKEEILRKFAE